VDRFGRSIVSSPPPAPPTITSKLDADTTSTEVAFGFDVATVLSSEGSPEPSGTFTISGSLPGLLYPGSSGLLRLTVSNPYDFDLRVSGFVVTVRPGSSQPGCDGRTNLQVTQSNTIGGLVSIVVRARGSVTLPSQGATAPRVTMLDLPVSQDACKNAVFTFSYGGSGTRA
jgi:hypothetical protein